MSDEVNCMDTVCNMRTSLDQRVIDQLIDVARTALELEEAAAYAELAQLDASDTPIDEVIAACRRVGMCRHAYGDALSKFTL